MALTLVDASLPLRRVVDGAMQGEVNATTSADGLLISLAGLRHSDGTQTSIGGQPIAGDSTIHHACNASHSISAIAVETIAFAVSSIGISCAPDPRFEVLRSGHDISSAPVGYFSLRETLHTRPARDEDPRYFFSAGNVSLGCLSIKEPGWIIPVCYVSSPALQSELDEHFFTARTAAIITARDRAKAEGRVFPEILLFHFPFRVTSPYASAINGVYSVSLNVSSPDLHFLVGNPYGEYIEAECLDGAFVTGISAKFKSDDVEGYFTLGAMNLSCSNSPTVLIHPEISKFSLKLIRLVAGFNAHKPYTFLICANRSSKLSVAN